MTEISGNRIQRLDNLTANQIAAGEVIERPVSVVKELIENAIDAQSSRIKVEIQDGGLGQIRITDNGSGIYSRDLPLAVERHATSKLRKIRDLDSLQTLGFRGEALASIASVAALEIVTRKKEEVQGSRLFVQGEEAKPVIGAAGCPVGTRITVEHLFFNTPARLKFMKTPGYEGGLIHDLLIQMALGYPEIDFRLESQGKKILDTAGVNTVPDLIQLFYGKEARGALTPLEALVSQSRVEGFVTAPPYSRGTRKGLHIFVNGRRVSVKDMQWSIERAFEFLLPKGRFPVAVLQFGIPGELLDVNVHPGKLEVRINDKGLFASLTRVIRMGISGGQLLPDAGELGGAAGGGANAEQTIGKLGNLEKKRAGTNVPVGKGLTGARQQSFGHGRGGIQTRDWEGLYRLPAEGEAELGRLLWDHKAGGFPEPQAFASGTEEKPASAGSGGQGQRRPETGEAGKPLRGLDEGEREGEVSAGAGSLASHEGLSFAMPPARHREPLEPGLWQALEHLEDKSPEETKHKWGVAVHTKTLQQMARAVRPEDFCFRREVSFRVIGQLHDTFILAEVEAGLLIVDQHVAHERILYETFLAREEEQENQGTKAAQLLAIPVSVNLTSLEEEILVKNIMVLNDMGLILERFGPRSYLIRSLPAGQKSLDGDMFKDLLAQLAEAGGKTEAREARDRLLVMMSCKQAVKANTPLSEKEMLALLQGLQKCRHPMTCPHGRPIMYLLPFNRLLSAFGRSL